MKRVVIFGTGKSGEEAFDYARERGWAVAYFVDNNKIRCGESVRGVKIKAPTVLQNKDFNLIVVASIPGKSAISEQLDKMGFAYQADYIYFPREPVPPKPKFAWPWYVVFAYPFINLFATPVRLIQALWACRVLAKGKWSNYLMFNYLYSINRLVYMTVATNIDRYGRDGESPVVGLGNFKMTNWFHYSLASLYMNWRLGPVISLIGMFGWLAAFSLWSLDVDTWWVALIIGLAFISVMFYINMFILQNYNVIGWMFFPVYLYGIYSDQWLIVAIGLLAASFGSFTVAVTGIVLLMAVALSSWSLTPIIAAVPSMLKLILHLIPAALGGSFNHSFQYIASSTGLTEWRTKYKLVTTKWVHKTGLIQLLLYTQFLLNAYFVTGELSVLLLTGILLSLLNNHIARFADVQTTYMFTFSLATAVIIQHPSWIMLVSYWLAISPPPSELHIPMEPGTKHIVPRCAPFKITPIIKDMEKFLEPVHQGERVLLAYDDPQGDYSRVFDGYRFLLELPFYVGTVKQTHIFPDWWAVFELNYKGAPDFWGRDVNSVLNNLSIWKADLAVIYQDAGTELERKWEVAGFTALGEFRWDDYHKGHGVWPCPSVVPTWWLLRKPSEPPGAGA